MEKMNVSQMKIMKMQLIINAKKLIKLIVNAFSVKKDMFYKMENALIILSALTMLYKSYKERKIYDEEKKKLNIY